jgi:hypothetical protein
MKNKRVRWLSVLLFLSLLLGLFSCGHVSSYSALLLIRSNSSGVLSVRFDSLKGELYESFRKDAGGEGAFSYSASLEEGELSVFYEDEKGALCSLFTVKGGESVSDIGGSIDGKEGKRVHILLKADEKCRGGNLEIRFVGGEKT